MPRLGRMGEPCISNSPGLGYESGGYAPFFTDNLSIQARAASFRSSEAMRGMSTNAANLYSIDQYTSGAFLNSSRTDVICERKRNQMETGGVFPSGLVNLFLLQ